MIGAGGIYIAFLWYGSLQEDVFSFQTADGTKFTFVWFLQCMEACTNIVVGLVGRHFCGGVPNLPLRQFALTGLSQVLSKALTALSLASGLSFPVATLAKSGKMAPVMLGQLILGGATYSLREYSQVAAIIGGTAMLSLGKKGGESTLLGVLFIILSLVMDGITGGVQKKLKADMARIGLAPKPYDFMLYTNISMATIAFIISISIGDFAQGWNFCSAHPQILTLVIQFSCCSAIGQSFIFYTVANFDPLVCSTVTTTRKIVSVLLSIILKGHTLSLQGLGGLSLAIGGILSEVHAKINSSRKLKSKVSM